MSPTAAEPGALRQLGPVPQLDGLRGVAVLLVVAFHVMSVLVPPIPTLNPDVLPGGFLGVDLFFVLSGYLITALLLRNRQHSGSLQFFSFYRGRALRLLPALLVFLVAHVIWASVVDLPADLERSSILSALLYYLNWKTVWDFSVSEGLGHLWSLAVEEQFYILWPLVVLAIVQLRRWRWLVPALLAGLIVVVVIHRTQLWDDGQSFFFLYMRTDTRVDSLLVGALLAFLWVHRQTPTRGLAPAGWLATAVLAICIGFVPVTNAFLYKGGYTIVALAAATIILATVESNWSLNRLLRTLPLRAVGRVSYGLYLWHAAVFAAVVHSAPDWATWVRVTVALLATAVLTVTSWFVVERPALAWKRRLDQRVRTTADARDRADLGAPAVARPAGPDGWREERDERSAPSGPLGR